MDKKIINVGSLNFNLIDYREDEFNQSVDCSFDLWGDKMDDAVSIENFYYYCRRFALAMGFTEKTVNEWFD